MAITFGLQMPRRRADRKTASFALAQFLQSFTLSQ